ncbi:MAG: hypothetical protein IJ689_07220 [Alphaproteobacteria bacterium]|nr:hypothetical protein [Alphaproteobacteria bacterium]
MNKYILLTAVAGVALGSYCAYASNSATTTVTATIAHDVSLTKTGDINLGTITINPAYTGDTTRWEYSDSGVISYTNQGAIVSAPNATVGTFTANIHHPDTCDAPIDYCEGLSVEGNKGEGIADLFGASNSDINGCGFYILYSGTKNSFKVFPGACLIGDVSSVTPGEHSGTLTIQYTPES